MDSLAEHIFKADAQGITLKSAVMEHAVIRRGLPYRRFNKYLILVEPSNNDPLAFYNMLGPSVSTAGSYLADRKPDSRILLAESTISVPKSELFTRKQFNAAWGFAQSLAGGAVVKPTRLARGRGVTSGIRSYSEFQNAWERGFDAYQSTSRNRQVIVEEHFSGEDFRCFVVGDRFISATQRRRPQVVGDGASTLESLIVRKNIERSKHPTLNTYPIPLDPALLDQMRISGLDLRYTPTMGEVVVLRRTSNLSGGGDSVDMTNVIHPGFRDIAVESAAAIPGLTYMGVDIIASSIAVHPSSDNHAVTEVETSPGPLTDFPVEGTPRDMAGPILEHYLPQ